MARRTPAARQTVARGHHLFTSLQYVDWCTPCDSRERKGVLELVTSYGYGNYVLRLYQ